MCTCTGHTEPGGGREAGRREGGKGEGGRREERREEGNKSTCAVHMGQSGSHEALLLAVVLVSLVPGSPPRAHSKGHQSLQVRGGELGTRLGGREREWIGGRKMG